MLSSSSLVVPNLFFGCFKPELAGGEKLISSLNIKRKSEIARGRKNRGYGEAEKAEICSLDKTYCLFIGWFQKTNGIRVCNTSCNQIFFCFLRFLIFLLLTRA